MPVESQLLYFHMVLRADDDGVVESYPLMKLLGIPGDVFKILLAKGFIQQLNEDQVVVIIDWLEHNTIRADRKVDSIYKELIIEKVPEIKLIEAKPRIDVQDNSNRVRGQSTVSLSKVKLSKDRLVEVNTTPSTKEGGSSEYSEEFLSFWNAYPKKTGKGEANKSWLKLHPSKALSETILASVLDHASSKDWTKEEGRYIPLPATFLNQRRFEDELIITKAQTKFSKYD